MRYIVIILFILALYIGGHIGAGLLNLMIGLIMFRLGVNKKLCAAYVIVWTIAAIIDWFHPLPVVLIPGTKQNLLGAPGVFWSLIAIIIYSIGKGLYLLIRDFCSNQSNKRKIVPGNYVYIEPEPGIWTTGIYGRDGSWFPESDHQSPEDAAQRVNYLNGARPA